MDRPIRQATTSKQLDIFFKEKDKFLISGDILLFLRLFLATLIKQLVVYKQHGRNENSKTYRSANFIRDDQVVYRHCCHN